MSLYGTRDAARNFQREVTMFMQRNGFSVGKYNVCKFYHQKIGIRTLVHGDDFISSGGRKSLKWFKERLTERLEI